MELRHLRYFIAVADELSFSRAAERLRIAQPPLSQQIQALEQELGVKLFDRKSRPLQLTPAGRAFLEEARATLLQLERAVHKTRAIDQGQSGALTIGFTGSIANSIFPEILLAFRRQNPDIKLIMQEEKTALILQKLRERQMDIIFLYSYREAWEDTSFQMTILAQEPLVLVLPKDHRLAERTTLSLKDIEEEEFIMPLHNVSGGLSEQIYFLCSQAKFEPKVSQTALFMVTILGLVAGGTGISILPASVRNLQRQGVIYRSLLEQTRTCNLMAIWFENHSSKVLPVFLDFLRSRGEPEGNTLDQTLTQE
jgi:DNA-binding transcriptional LysR family regulator